MIPISNENIIFKIMKKNKKIFKSKITVVSMVTTVEYSSKILKKKNVFTNDMMTTITIRD